MVGGHDPAPGGPGNHMERPMKPISDALEVVHKHVTLKPYSGRGMYGTYCASLSAKNESELMKKLRPALRDPSMTDEMCDEVEDFCTDELGKGIIAYWPGVPMVYEFGDMRSCVQTGEYNRIPSPQSGQQQVWRDYVIDTASRDFERFMSKCTLSIDDFTTGMRWESVRQWCGDHEVTGDNDTVFSLWAGNLKLGEIPHEQRILWCMMAVLHMFDEWVESRLRHGEKNQTRYGLFMEPHDVARPLSDDYYGSKRNRLIDSMVAMFEVVGGTELSSRKSSEADDLLVKRSDRLSLQGLFGTEDHAAMLAIMAGVVPISTTFFDMGLERPGAPFMWYDVEELQDMKTSDGRATHVNPDIIDNHVPYYIFTKIMRSAVYNGFVPIVIEELVCAMWDGSGLDTWGGQTRDTHRTHFIQWYRAFAFAQVLESA